MHNKKNRHRTSEARMVVTPNLGHSTFQAALIMMEYDHSNVMDRTAVREGSIFPVQADTKWYHCSQVNMNKFQYPSNNNRRPFVSLKRATMELTRFLESSPSPEVLRVLSRLLRILRTDAWNPIIILMVVHDLDFAFCNSILWGNNVVEWMTTDQLFTLNSDPEVFGITIRTGSGRCIESIGL